MLLCRTFQSDLPLQTEHQRAILDGALLARYWAVCEMQDANADTLFRFVNLDRATQRDLARMIGTTPDMIVDNLLEAELQYQYF
jgi:hypothetical protein